MKRNSSILTKVGELKDTEGHSQMQEQIARLQTLLSRLNINLERDLDRCEENGREKEFSNTARVVLDKEITEAKRSRAVDTDRARRDTVRRLSRAMQTMRSMDPEDNFAKEGDALLTTILTTETGIAEHVSKGDDRQQR